MKRLVYILILLAAGACAQPPEHQLCDSFTYQEDAQAALNGGAAELDSDGDGTACESLPSKLQEQPAGSGASSADVAGSSLVLVGDLVPSSGAPGGGLGNAGAVASLTSSLDPAAIVHLGDLQYEYGSLDLFNRFYDGIWGNVKSKIKPVVGNHEYGNGAVPGADGYRAYFGAQAYPDGKSYYSFNVNLPDGNHWHVVVLNSNCSRWSPAPGCGLTQEMENWLRADLAADDAKCTLAVWHEPAFGSDVPYYTATGGNVKMRTPWWTLERRGVDLVVAGHAHNYQRYQRLTHDGVESSSGLRSYIVGTGGKSLGAFSGNWWNRSALAAADDSHYGVLKLSLRKDGWTSAFKTTNGRSLDPVAVGCK